MKLTSHLERRSVRHLTRLAALLALAGLAVMVYSVVWPRPLAVIMAMSIGQALGVAAFLCYLLAVVLDVSRSTPPPDSLRPAPPSQRPPPPPRAGSPPPPPR